MSKLDFVTVAIFVVCIAAIVFLIFKTTQLINGSESPGVDRQSIEESEPTPYGDYYDPNQDGAGAFEPYNPAGEEEDDAVDVYDPVGDDSGFEQPATAAPSRSSTRTASSSQGRYMVLAGSFRQRANAETTVRRLKNLGYADAEVGITNNGAFAVAVVDRFNDINQARALVRELGTQYQIEAMVKE